MPDGKAKTESHSEGALLINRPRHTRRGDPRPRPEVNGNRAKRLDRGRPARKQPRYDPDILFWNEVAAHARRREKKLWHRKTKHFGDCVSMKALVEQWRKKRSGQ